MYGILVPFFIVSVHRIREKKILKIGLAVVLIFLFALFYTAAAAKYRSQLGYASTSSKVPAHKRAQTFRESFFSTTKEVKSTIHLVACRVFEKSGLEIVLTAKGKEKLYGFTAMEDIFLQYIPQTIYKGKGAKRGNDILVAEGINICTMSFAPITLIGDCYYRFRLSGIISFYFFLGVFLSLITLNLIHNGDFCLYFNKT